MLIIAISSYGFVLSVFELIRFLKLEKVLNFKPFNCVLCLSFWYGLIIGILVYHCLIRGLICSFASIVFSKIFDKYLIDKIPDFLDSGD